MDVDSLTYMKDISTLVHVIYRTYRPHLEHTGRLHLWFQCLEAHMRVKCISEPMHNILKASKSMLCIIWFCISCWLTRLIMTVQLSQVSGVNVFFISVHPNNIHLENSIDKSTCSLRTSQKKNVWGYTRYFHGCNLSFGTHSHLSTDEAFLFKSPPPYSSALPLWDNMVMLDCVFN